MPADLEQPAAASLTGKPGKRAALPIAVLLCSCSHVAGVAGTYQRTWQLFAAGDLSQAAEACSKELAGWPDPKSPWHWSFRLLQAEALSAQGKSKDADALLKDAVPPLPELRRFEARRLVDQAYLNRNDAAVDLLQRAANMSPDMEVEIRIPLVRGRVELNRQQYEAARSALQSAAELAARRGNPYWEAQALASQCFAYKGLRRYEQSVEVGLRALVIAEKIGARRVAGLAHGNLGSAYLLLGELDLARKHQQAAIKILEAIGDRVGFMIALGELGLVFDTQDDREKAIASYERAYRIACELGGRQRDAARHAENLALAKIHSKQWASALEWNDRASEIASHLDADDTAPYLARNRALIAYGRGDPNQAIRICDALVRDRATPASILWAVHALLGTIHANAKRFAQANREYETALKSIEATRSDLLNARFKMTLLSRLMPFYREYTDWLVQQGDDLGALRVVESSRARVLSERLGGSLRAQAFPNTASLQRLALSTNSTILSFWLAPGRGFVWVIAATGVRRFQLPPAGEIEKLATAYRGVVEHALRDPILTNDALGPKLWQALLGEAGAQIPKGSRVIAIPDGALHRLNLETLVAPLPKPHYWVEDVEISVAPSITIAASKLAPANGRGQSLLLIGDPEYAGTPFPPLKNASAELRNIRMRFPSPPPVVYAKSQATPGIYRESAPDRFALIHFAAHAEANGEDPLDSAVILSRRGGQNRLYARDVINVKIHADVVTISACESAGVRSYAGEGLIGFAWAFLQAGARNVVAGLWDVSDSSTEALMDQFYAGIAAGQSPPAALHAAKLKMHQDPLFAKPFYWGPFQTYIAGAGKSAAEKP